MTHFTDRMVIDGGPRKTSDGYAVISARVARGDNVQLYLGSEFGLKDQEYVRVFRPSAEVFKKDAIASYAGVPITLDHPAGKVDAASWKDLAVGEVGDEILRDGEFVRVPMMLRDAKAIERVEAGVRELSMGYDAKIVMQDGVSPSGEKYDAIMSDFKMNHVAIVDQARGGKELRIGDSADHWGIKPLYQDHREKERRMNLKTVTVDGIPIEVTDQGATVIDTLTKRLNDTAAKLTSLETAHQTVLAAKDADLAKKDAEIDALKGKVLDAKAIDALVASRAGLVSIAAAIAKDVKTDGLSDADIKKAVVTAKLGDAAIAGKAQAYIDARFDILAEGAKDAVAADPFRTVMADGVQSTDGHTVVAKAQQSYVDSLTNGWQGNTKGNA